MKSRLISTILLGLMTINVAVATDKDSGRPRLVVGIVVDQLRTDHLEYLRSLFGEKGFQRLMGKGVFVKDVDFKSHLDDPASATALIYSGAYPAVTGIPSEKIYYSASRKSEPALSDPSSLGNFTQEALSPANLRTSTISDEVVIDGEGLTSVYAISPNPQQAIIMAGHSGNCALWINDADGKWSSTAYYRDFPQFVTQINRNSPLRQRLDTIRWTPLLKTSEYPSVPASKQYYAFKYNFLGSDRDLYKRFKVSAPVNAEITDLAIRAIKDLPLGKRQNGIDMLSIGYTAAPYPYVNEGDGRIELADTYVRLDAQLGRLFDAIDKYVGLENSVIFLSSTGYYQDPTPVAEKYRIPGGEISMKRVESLLNSYLTAKYGNSDYIEKISDGQIYLNHKLLEAKTSDLNAAIADARDFIVKMSGVTSGKTLSEILSDATTEGERMRNSIDPKKSGDIFLIFSPGWKVTDDTQYPAVSTLQRDATPSTPFFLMAPNVTPTVITTPVDAVQIAPTISSTLHIRAPNGASGRQINWK